jgi:hypothetical protein
MNFHGYLIQEKDEKMKKILITEQQLKNIIKEDYPMNFNFDEMLKLSSYAKRIAYCKERLVFLGKGSSRMAFKVDESKVIKIAVNGKGIKQNMVEINSYNDYFSEILAKVIDYSDDGIFLEMEIAKKPKPNDFKRIFGFGLDVISEYLKYRWRTMHNERMNYIPVIIEDIIDDLDEIDELNSIIEFCNNNNINPNDFGTVAQWGIVNRNNNEYLVIVDYGYSEDVKKLYYK